MNKVYYLSSLESVQFEQARICTIKKIVHLETGKECIVVSVNPPVIGQQYNSGADFDTLVLTNRFKNNNVSNPKKFPCFVFICRLLTDDIDDTDVISKNDLQIIARGEIYESYDSAQRHAFPR